MAWLLMTGSQADGEIDHINCVRDDNRFSNLRVVSTRDNAHNKARNIRNKSGVNGVRWHKRDKCWQAHIGVDRTFKHLGSFASLEEAAAARAAANVEYGFTERHGLPPEPEFRA